MIELRGPGGIVVMSFVVALGRGLDDVRVEHHCLGCRRVLMDVSDAELLAHAAAHEAGRVAERPRSVEPGRDRPEVVWALTWVPAHGGEIAAMCGRCRGRIGGHRLGIYMPGRGAWTEELIEHAGAHWALAQLSIGAW